MGENELSPALATCLLSLRAFEAHHMMIDADIAEGEAALSLMGRMLGDRNVAYLHAHYARWDCYAGWLDRV